MSNHQNNLMEPKTKKNRLKRIPKKFGFLSRIGLLGLYFIVLLFGLIFQLASVASSELGYWLTGIAVVSFVLEEITNIGRNKTIQKRIQENRKAELLAEARTSFLEEDSQVVARQINQAETASVFANREFIYSDELLPAAVEVVLETGQASVSMLQRRLKLGYARAARIVDEMEDLGFVGPFRGSTPRAILISLKEWNVVSDRMIYVEVETPAAIPQYEPKKAECSLAAIDGMDGHSFEWLCADLLRCDGFIDVTVTPGSGDQGVDIVAQKDGVRYAIQCKCYSSDLGNKPVQEVYAGKEMYGCQVAAVMTNRFFTSGAKQLAEKTRVLLWDRNYLTRLVEKSKESNSSNQSFS